MNTTQDSIELCTPKTWAASTSFGPLQALRFQAHAFPPQGTAPILVQSYCRRAGPAACTSVHPRRRAATPNL